MVNPLPSFKRIVKMKKLKIKEGTKKIDSYQYKDRKDIEELIIADSVEEIGASAFSGCFNLKKITWGKHVHTIGDGAFLCCFSLESLHLPNSIKYVGNSAFISTGLTYVEFEDNDEVVIGNSAFAYCSRLIYAILPIGLKHIYAETFYACSKLEDVFIPETVTSIGIKAFSEIAAEQIELPNSIETISMMAFYNSELTSVDLPDSVLAIGESVFGLCCNLRSVKIGKSIVHIEKKAFEDCSALNEVTFRSTIIGSIGTYVFKGCKNLKRINVPVSAMDTYKRLLPKYLHRKLVEF